MGSDLLVVKNGLFKTSIEINNMPSPKISKGPQISQEDAGVESGGVIY